MRTRSSQATRFSLFVAGMLATFSVVVVIMVVVAAPSHRHPLSAGRDVQPGSAPGPRSERLDDAGMADLAVLRTATRRTAASASAAVESCVQRHGTVPVDRRARTIRNCAFRSLAGAGASGGLNAMIVSSLRDRLRTGRCLAKVSAFGTLLSAFSASAEEVVRTTGAWDETHAALMSTDRLGRWIVREGRSAGWEAACLRAPVWAGHEAA
ncbi:MAG TPA: hypothetical protein VFT50_17150 [Baekduia sp.]|nr:hypothetical protein [Baekduia sp.]